MENMQNNTQTNNAEGTTDTKELREELFYVAHSQINAIEAMCRIFEIIRCMDTTYTSLFDESSPMLTVYLPEARAFLEEKGVMNLVLLQALNVLDNMNEHSLDEIEKAVNEVEVVYVKLSQKYKMCSMFINAIGEEDYLFWENLCMAFYTIFYISGSFPILAKMVFFPMFFNAPTVFSVFFYMYGEEELSKFKVTLEQLFKDEQYRGRVCMFLRSMFLDRTELFDRLLTIFEKDPHFSSIFNKEEATQSQNIQ